MVHGLVSVLVLVIVIVLVFVSLPRLDVIVPVFVPSPIEGTSGAAAAEGFLGGPLSVLVFVTVIVFVFV